MVKIAPSLLAADFSRLREEVKIAESAGADYLHLDIMDGHFVPNITFGPGLVADLRKVTELPFDVHLMIERPENYLKDFVDAGADIISVHAEACTHLSRVLEKIKELGAKSAVALNPATSLEIIRYVLHQVDMVLLMTVNPGFGGQQYIPQIESKIMLLKKWIKKEDKKIMIEVDGGINVKNAFGAIAAGAEVLVAGSAIFGSDDVQQAIRDLRESGL